MEGSIPQESKRRKLIIPHKRPLLPTGATKSLSLSSSSSSASVSQLKGVAVTKIQKTINPSALPAQIQLRRPVFSSLETTEEDEGNADRKDQKGSGYKLTIDDNNDDEARVIRIEFDSSQAPQPFLEPDYRERIMEERRKKRSAKEVEQQEDEEEMGEIKSEESLTAQQSTEREVRRRAAQVDYGSMAIKDRMRVSGRGRRRH